MEASTSSLSHPPNPPISLYDRTASKSSTDHSLQLDVESEATTPRPRESLHVRFNRQFSSRFPHIHERGIRVARYWRGPRPKVELPEPVPFLNIKWNIKGQQIVLPFEASLVKGTRRFGSPWLFLLLTAAYIIGLAFFSRAQSFLTPELSYIECTSAYWPANDGCGLDGLACSPFNGPSLDFRCPAQCDGTSLQNPRTVGNEQVVFEPLIVGGGDANATYRGDSFICAAAIQAGLISGTKGGCASLQLVGNFTNFLPKSANGLTSLGFPSVFPLSFRFDDFTSLKYCKDHRNSALALNILVTCLLFFILRPKPLVLYWCLVCIGFWHVSLFSQPPRSPPAIDMAFGTFLPALFVAYTFWRVAFRFTLPAFSKAPIEAAVLFLAPYWVGVLTNMTTDKIPISRLTSADITKRSGGIKALVIIVLIVTVMFINQIRVIRKTGWLPQYAGWYVLGGLVILVISLLPRLQLRLHHYILPILLIPGTAFPTRLSLIYQGILLGMFLNGVAAFGFAPIVQSAASLRRDGPSGSFLPTFLTNSTTYNSSIPFINQTIAWDVLPEGWDGFVLLVDDVERYIGTSLNFSLAAFNSSLPHFFRLAFTSAIEMGDFTKPATLWPNGTWVDPLPGPS